MTKQTDKLKELVIDEFSGKNTQETYKKRAEEGLWEFEKLLINRYFKKKSKTLDIGCGTGRSTIPLFKQGYKIIGIDITPAMIKNAKKIAENKGLKINYKVMDACNLKFRKKSFDNVLFSNQGWTQIPGSKNRLKALKEIYRVLKPKGRYIFSVHQRRWFSKYFSNWIMGWFKFYILKNLGFKTDELDFGDRFFKRETKGSKFKTKQYIHIAKIKGVERQLKKIGFKIIYKEVGLSDSSGSKPLFFACEKI
jgi:ubiquinone/menaquinone biosynthesis C-methylase UbiE